MLRRQQSNVAVSATAHIAPKGDLSGFAGAPIFGREDLHLLTDDGRLLSLRFCEKELPPASNSTHVDVAGDLPLQSEWRY